MKLSAINIAPDHYKKSLLSWGYKAGNILFISGQVPIDQTGNIIGVGNFEQQVYQVFKNLERVLKSGGSSFANVIKLTVLVSDINNLDKFVALKRNYFSYPYPAETAFEVSSLFSPDALIEIDAIAVEDDIATR